MDVGRGGVERRDTLRLAATPDAHTRPISGPEWVGHREVTFTFYHMCVSTQARTQRAHALALSGGDEQNFTSGSGNRPVDPGFLARRPTFWPGLKGPD